MQRKDLTENLGEESFDENIGEFTLIKNPPKITPVVTNKLQHSISDAIVAEDYHSADEIQKTTQAQIAIFLSRMKAEANQSAVATLKPQDEIKVNEAKESFDSTFATNENHPSVVSLEPESENSIIDSRPSIDLNALTSSSRAESYQPTPQKSAWMKWFSCLCPCIKEDKTEEFINTSRQYWTFK